MKSFIRRSLALLLAFLTFTGSHAFALDPLDLDNELITNGWQGITWIRTWKETEKDDLSALFIQEDATMNGYPVSVIIQGSSHDSFNDYELDQILFTTHSSQMTPREDAIFPNALQAYIIIYLTWLETINYETDRDDRFNYFNILENVIESGGTICYETADWTISAEITEEIFTFRCDRKEASVE